MSESLINSINLDRLLTPSQLSLDKERNNSLAVSDYLIRNSENSNIDLSLYSNTLKVNTKELMEHHQINLKPRSKKDLFDILNSKSLTINPLLFFPKVKHINDLFWFLSHLSRKNIKNTKLILETSNEFSELSNNLIESAVFFGYLTHNRLDNEVYLIPTNDFEFFNDKTLEEQYTIFLKNVGAVKTIRDSINIQLNDPIFDNLSKRMVFKKLKANQNIIEESLTDSDINKIVVNVRYWFLDIKKYIL